MRIEDLLRNAVPKPESSPVGASGKSRTVLSQESGAAFLAKTGDAELFLPDLLQTFTQLIAKRQSLTAELPASVQQRLTGALTSSSLPEGAASNRQATIGEGMTGLVRDNRAIPDLIRQLVSELNFVEHTPSLPQTYLSATSAGRGTPEALQLVVDDGLAILSDELTLTGSQLPTPSLVLAGLVDKAVQTGTISAELSAWIDTLGAAVDSQPDDSPLLLKINTVMNSVDPQIAQAAQLTGRPELVRVWAATQLLDNAEVAASFAKLGVQAEGTLGTVDALQTVLQNLTNAATAKSTTLPATGLMGSYPRSIQLEMLVTVAMSQPATLDSMLAILPTVMTNVKSSFSLRSDDPVEKAGVEKILATAPKWLSELSDRLNKPELMEFWVAAKAADLAPWIELSSTERHLSMDSLKELAISFEQPEAFRQRHDDANSHSLTFQTVLYAPGQENPYPALIQIYEEKKERGTSQPPEQGIWIRLSLETHNIGTVELSFRLQDKKYLSVYSRFADSAVAVAFQEYLPELQNELADSTFEVKKIAIAQRSQSG